MSKTAVLAYSGGLDTSCAIAWLKEDYGFDEVVAVLVDVGQEADFDAGDRARLRGGRERGRCSSTASDDVRRRAGREGDRSRTRCTRAGTRSSRRSRGR